jgi:hypothetical protein
VLIPLLLLLLLLWGQHPLLTPAAVALVLVLLLLRLPCPLLLLSAAALLLLLQQRLPHSLLATVLLGPAATAPAMPASTSAVLHGVRLPLLLLPHSLMKGIQKRTLCPACQQPARALHAPCWLACWLEGNSPCCCRPHCADQKTLLQQAQ